MSDYNHIAANYLSAKDSLAGILLRVEHLCRTFEVPDALVNTGSLYYTAVLSDVSEQNSQTAVL